MVTTAALHWQKFRKRNLLYSESVWIKNAKATFRLPDCSQLISRICLLFFSRFRMQRCSQFLECRNDPCHFAKLYHKHEFTPLSSPNSMNHAITMAAVINGCVIHRLARLRLLLIPTSKILTSRPFALIFLMSHHFDLFQMLASSQLRINI